LGKESGLRPQEYVKIIGGMGTAPFRFLQVHARDRGRGLRVLARIARTGKPSDRLRAAELVGKQLGMFRDASPGGGATLVRRLLPLVYLCFPRRTTMPQRLNRS
jgi:hypothetical protein